MKEKLKTISTELKRQRLVDALIEFDQKYPEVIEAIINNDSIRKCDYTIFNVRDKLARQLQKFDYSTSVLQNEK